MKTIISKFEIEVSFELPDDSELLTTKRMDPKFGEEFPLINFFMEEEVVGNLEKLAAKVVEGSKGENPRIKVPYPPIMFDWNNEEGLRKRGLIK